MSNENELTCETEFREMCDIYMELMNETNIKLKELKMKKDELSEFSESIKNTLINREIDKVQLKGGSLRIKVEKKTSGLTKKLFESFLDKVLVTKLYEEREAKEVITLKYLGNQDCE